jgi:HAD superfamily hydrolase (TIGR01509 family)
MPIKGLVFDFDGLILDTETPEFIVLQQIYREHGLEFDPILWSAAVGASLAAFHPIQHLQAQLSYPVDEKSLHKEWLTRSRLVIDQSGPLPGVIDLVASAREMGLKLAVASSSPKEWVFTHMDRLNLHGWFEAIWTMDDVSKIKPDPELYLKAVQSLGISPAEAIAFEDSPNGIQAALTAGLFTVAVPNPVTSLMDTSKANLVLSNLKDVTLDSMISLAISKNGR